MKEEHTLDQNKAPIYEALQTFRQMRVVPFDVPGHKRGRGNPELTRFLGEQCVSIDVNSMKPLDNLCHPISVIREAEELAADAFGAAHAFLMVGGTTSSVQSMVLSTCKRGDKIIMPRNVHRSVINALVLCGAIPVYVNPEVDPRLGISLGMKREQVARAIRENPDAVAVLVNNPTYYGICSDLRAIVEMAHEAGMYCLADEAHGTHFYFGDHMPVSAMEAGADMASVSMHKSGGSLTQSSLLLIGPGIHEGHVRKIINLTQTTSGSYLLMSSLDISRRNLALRGREVFRQVCAMAEYAREEINAVGGYYAFGRGAHQRRLHLRLRPHQAQRPHPGRGSGRHRGLRPAPGRVRHPDRIRRYRQYPGLSVHGGPDPGSGTAGQCPGRNPPPLSNRRQRPDEPGIHRPPRWSPAPRRPSTRTSSSVRLRTVWDRCAANSLCAIPRHPHPGPRGADHGGDPGLHPYAKEKGCSMTGPEDPEIEEINILTQEAR